MQIIYTTFLHNQVKYPVSIFKQKFMVNQNVFLTPFNK